MKINRNDLDRIKFLNKKGGQKKTMVVKLQILEVNQNQKQLQ